MVESTLPLLFFKVFLKAQLTDVQRLKIKCTTSTLLFLCGFFLLQEEKSKLSSLDRTCYYQFILCEMGTAFSNRGSHAGIRSESFFPKKKEHVLVMCGQLKWNYYYY